MKQCLKCPNKVFSRGLCSYHWKREYQKPIARKLYPVKKVRDNTGVKNTQIKAKSKKQVKGDREYAAGRKQMFYGEFESEGFVRCRGCDGVAEGTHHPGGRVGDRMTDKESLIPLCRDCHLWIETHPQEAIALGFSVSRLNINNK